MRTPRMLLMGAALIALIALWAGWPRPASANTGPPETLRQACPMGLLVVNDASESIELPMYVERWTAILWPGEIEPIGRAGVTADRFEVRALHDMLFVRATSAAEVGDILFVTVKSEMLAAQLRFHVTDRPSTDQRMLMAVGETDAPADASGGGSDRPGWVVCLPTELASISPSQRDAWALLTDIAVDYERIPIAEPVSPSSLAPGVHLRAEAWGKTPNYRLLFFEVWNRTHAQYELGSAVLRDDSWEQTERAYSVWVDGRPLEEAARVVQPGERVSGMVWVKDPATLGETVSLTVSDKKRERPVARERIPVWDLREPEDKERKREIALAKQTWIGVHALYGAMFLQADDGDPLTDGGDTDATSVKGFGIRVTKGLVARDTGTTAMLSLEVEAAFAKTGTARFDGVMFDGRQGQLQTAATMGRVNAGLILRLGDRVAPVLRAGISATGYIEDARLETPSGSFPGPDRSFEVSGGLYGGGGVEIRLGAGFMAGVGMAILGIAGGRESLEAGLHVNYALGP